MKDTTKIIYTACNGAREKVNAFWKPSIYHSHKTNDALMASCKDRYYDAMFRVNYAIAECGGYNELSRAAKREVNYTIEYIRNKFDAQVAHIEKERN